MSEGAAISMMESTLDASMRAVEHHASAADHHRRAAQGHRESSRHYKIGKDYAHAAHLALAANGHALHALVLGRAAIDLYAAQEGSPLPGYLARSLEQSSSMEVAFPVSLDAAGHHAAAADHHDASARSHEAAEKHVEADHRIRALHCTKAALDHAMHALHHGNQAAMHHVAYYGSTAISSRTAVAELPAYPGLLTSNDTPHLVADGDHELA